jgi:predicted component of type VI protein secretion system
VRIRFHVLAALTSVLLITGCGSDTPDKASIDKDKYEKMSVELYDLQNKGKFTLADTEKFYKKHGVSKNDYETAISVYGKAEGVKAKEKAAIEKMTKGAKAPPPR